MFFFCISKELIENPETENEYKDKEMSEKKATC